VTEREQLEAAIATQEQLRGVVADAVIDTTVAALKRELVALQQTAERRRQVTILFADVSGFTAMSERMDAEEVAQVMNDLWRRLDGVVHQFGGRIDKHIGDALMAVWGGDEAREDDPEQALRAALGLQDELTVVRDAQRLELRMRVGVNTGPVLLGPVAGTTEFTAMGDAVNVASRLEHAAPIGGVLISHDTYRHVRGVFDVHELEPIMLKGKSDPVRIYVVKRAKERAFRVASRGVEGVETTTVGRRDELARLCAEYDSCRSTPGVGFVVVVGDAGIGKSRLLYEFRNWIELRREEVYLFMGRALLGQDQQALGLLRDVLVTRLDVLQSDAPAVVAQRLREGLAPALTGDEAEILGHWLGFEVGDSDAVNRLAGSPGFADVARSHLFAWLKALTADEPGVLLLEDLHWADDETLDVVERLAARCDMQLLIVGLARPTLYERRPGWGGDAVRVDLHALGADGTRELVLEVLRHAGDVPERLVNIIVDRADGNPFYVEELVKMLIDDGVISIGDFDQPWQVDVERLDESRVPKTLTGVLQARLDGVPADERSALQRASVVGRVFWDEAVAALGHDGGPHATAAIDSACRRELVHRRTPSAFVDCVEFIFKHALLRDVTYETVLLKDRRSLHSAAAAWFESTAGLRVAEYREIIAYHLELAGDPAGAAQQLQKVGETALQSGNTVGATRAMSRVIELCDLAGVEPPAAVFAVLARAGRRLGDVDAATAAVARGLFLAAGDASARARLHHAASLLAMDRADGDVMRRELMLARSAVPFDDIITRSEIEIDIGWMHARRGDLDEAIAAATSAFALSEAHGDVLGCSRAEMVMGMVAAYRGDLEQAQLHAERELAFAVEGGDLDGVGLAQCHLAIVHHLLGDRGKPAHYAQAVRLYEEELEVCRRLAARPMEAVTLVNLAQVHLRLGDPERTSELLGEALRLEAEPVAGTLVLGLQVEADRRLMTGAIAAGLALLGHLRTLPVYEEADEVETQRILSRVELPTDEIDRLLAAGGTIDLQGVVARLRTDGDK
jgi:class 3 adenylate cyclase/tetratricopeptide (TPR) repeat protein